MASPLPDPSTLPATTRSERVRLCGAVGDPGFAPWIAAHARRLGVSVAIPDQRPDALELCVAGPPELVEAMLLACSLGPISVWVERVERNLSL